MKVERNKRNEGTNKVKEEIRMERKEKESRKRKEEIKELGKIIKKGRN
jgi:hypothetical protein